MPGVSRSARAPCPEPQTSRRCSVRQVQQSACGEVDVVQAVHSTGAAVMMLAEAGGHASGEASMVHSTHKACAFVTHCCFPLSAHGAVGSNICIAVGSQVELTMLHLPWQLVRCCRPARSHLPGLQQ